MIVAPSKYGSWIIQESLNGADAVAVLFDKEGSILYEVPLYRASPVMYDGWFNPFARNRAGSCAIAGICLYDRNWYVEFEWRDRSNPPGRKSPALESERLKIFERLRKGDRIVRMGIPRYPQTYHHDGIVWQGQSARRLMKKVVFYHIPVKEYHFYIAEIERAARGTFRDKDGVGAHEHLDRFCARIKAMVRAAFEGVEVIFIDPFPHANDDPYRSYLLPYLKPELFGIPTDGLIGIENLVEVSLTIRATAQGAQPIPVFTSVIGITNPYFEKGDGNGIIVLELEE